MPWGICRPTSAQDAQRFTNWNVNYRRSRGRCMSASSPVFLRSTAASCTTTFHAGLTTAAAAYHWVSEFYNRTPFIASRDRHTDDQALAIQHGHFYWNDHYPDSHLFADAESLRCKHTPDFLLVHPMNIDDAGHKHGLDSAPYRNSARSADIILADYLQGWLDADCQVLVTADHGMNNDRSHNGLLPEEREVPLFVLGSAFNLSATASPKQTELCGTVCELLGVPHDKPVCRELLK